MIQLRICIDVDDLEKAIAFYSRGLGLTAGRRFEPFFVEMLGAPSPIDLVASKAGTPASTTTGATRTFDRHWTPVHLDFVVADIDAAVQRVVDAGGTLDRPVRTQPYGRLANLADPFGNGLCLLEFNDRGYDALRDG